ncbi:MAG: hypothetical protein ACYS9X_18675 [Planctomycetota bacterium]|jgi:hypothetical protein
MSAWRRAALAALPKLRREIDKSESVGMLWVELWLAFADAHRDPVDEETTQGAYTFATWCLVDSRNGDIETSTICHFYEHLPTDPRVRERMHLHMTRQDFLGMVEVFKYHLSQEEHERFVADFLARRKS